MSQKKAKPKLPHLKDARVQKLEDRVGRVEKAFDQNTDVYSDVFHHVEARLAVLMRVENDRVNATVVTTPVFRGTPFERVNVDYAYYFGLYQAVLSFAEAVGTLPAMKVEEEDPTLTVFGGNR